MIVVNNLSPVCAVSTPVLPWASSPIIGAIGEKGVHHNWGCHFHLAQAGRALATFRSRACSESASGPIPVLGPESGGLMKDRDSDLPEKVPVVPPPREPGSPIPVIHPSRDPEDDPWLETYIDLTNIQGSDSSPATSARSKRHSTATSAPKLRLVPKSEKAAS